MPYGRARISVQLTGHADFWHPTGALLHLRHDKHRGRSCDQPATPRAKLVIWLQKSEKLRAVVSDVYRKKCSDYSRELLHIRKTFVYIHSGMAGMTPPSLVTYHYCSYTLR
jgi:hypothetical protein